MIACELETITILNFNGVDYRYVLWGVSNNEALNSMKSSKLDVRGTL